LFIVSCSCWENDVVLAPTGRLFLRVQRRVDHTKSPAQEM
jgi:hypothetical protein